MSIEPHDAHQVLVGRITEWLRLFYPAGSQDGYIELRSFSAEPPKLRRLALSDSGWPSRAAALALSWDGQAHGTYFTLNPGGKGPGRGGTEDGDILCRRWLPIDFDPVRPANTNSTDEEKAAAWELLRGIHGILGQFEGQVIADSGNGFHMCYPIDLPNDPDSRDLVKDFLAEMDSRFSTPAVKIDRKNFNASRIWKLYGTTTRKGEHSIERPHRRSGVQAGVPWSPAIAAANTAELRRLTAAWTASSRLRAESRPSAEERAREYLATCEPAVAGEGGHNHTFKIACKIVLGFDLDLPTAFRVMQDWNARCRPPWTEKELWHKLESAERQTGPRGYLLEEESEAAQPATGDSRTTKKGEAKPVAWAEPIPLYQEPAPAPFPLDVLPGYVQRFVEEAARSLACPIDFVAVPCLVAAAAAIGGALRLAITRTHRQPSILYAAIVGSPGTAKSPAARAALRPLFRLEERWREEHKRELKRWKDAGSENEEPIQRNLLVDDATIESLGPLFEANPRGLYWSRDELSGLVGALNQYREGGKGSDRQTILQLWDGSPIKVTRVRMGGRPLFVARPVISVCGTIQPDVLGRLREENGVSLNDGFFDRFLFAYPAKSPAVGDRLLEISAEAEECWDLIITRLAALPMQTLAEDGSRKDRPFEIPLTAEARQSWRAFTNDHAAEVNQSDFPPALEGPWAKLRGYCARLTLVIHAMREVADPALISPGVGPVIPQSVESATVLIRYFKSHARRAWGSLGTDQRHARAERILRWLKSTKRIAFSRAEAWQALRHDRHMFGTPESLAAPLDLLTQLRFVRVIAVAQHSERGRPPSDQFEVNPKVIGNERPAVDN